MTICGLQKTTLLDYPGHIAATVFLGGCNFRCPYCHNSELLGNSAKPVMTISELLRFLEKRQGILEGVCITGGEPTMDEEGLVRLSSSIRELGYLIKLDTNGTHPAVLKRLHSEDLLDYVALDIKSGPSRYPQVSGNPFVSMDNIKESVSWLLGEPLPYEFRTTVVKGLLDTSDFLEIGPWIAGCSHYYLQDFLASDGVLKPDGLSSFSIEELLDFCEILRPYVKEVTLRGVN